MPPETGAPATCRRALRSRLLSSDEPIGPGDKPGRPPARRFDVDGRAGGQLRLKRCHRLLGARSVRSGIAHQVGGHLSHITDGEHGAAIGAADRIGYDFLHWLKSAGSAGALRSLGARAAGLRWHAVLAHPRPLRAGEGRCRRPSPQSVRTSTGICSKRTHTVGHGPLVLCGIREIWAWPKPPRSPSRSLGGGVEPHQPCQSHLPGPT